MTEVLTAYFQVFPVYNFLIFIGMFVCAIIIYTLYSTLE
jgi:hypothetical protein